MDFVFEIGGIGMKLEVSGACISNAGASTPTAASAYLLADLAATGTVGNATYEEVPE